MPAILTLREGEMGSGKSYGTVADIVYKYLPERTGAIIHNLPLKHDAIADFMQRRGFPRAEVLERLIAIEPDVVDDWKRGLGGPWDLHRSLDEDLAKSSVILLDEAHTMLGDGFHANHNKAWNEWLRELRHEHGEIQLITQNVDDFPRKIQRLAGLELTTTNFESKLRPWIFGGGREYEWRQLWAGIFKYKATYGCWIIEYRRVGRRRIKDRERCYEFRPEIYALYNSTSATTSGHGGGDKQPDPCELFSRWGIIVWYVKQVGITAFAPFGLVAVMVTLASVGIYILYGLGSGSMLAAREAEVKRQQASALNYKPASVAIKDIEAIPAAVAAAVSKQEPEVVPDPVVIKPASPRVVGLLDGAIVTDEGEVIHVGQQFNGETLEHVGGGFYVLGERSFRLLRRPRKDDSVPVDSPARPSAVRTPSATPARTAAGNSLRKTSN